MVPSAPAAPPGCTSPRRTGWCATRRRPGGPPRPAPGQVVVTGCRTPARPSSAAGTATSSRTSPWRRRAVRLDRLHLQRLRVRHRQRPAPGRDLHGTTRAGGERRAHAVRARAAQRRGAGLRAGDRPRCGRSSTTATTSRTRTTGTSRRRPGDCGSGSPRSSTTTRSSRSPGGRGRVLRLAVLQPEQRHRGNRAHAVRPRLRDSTATAGRPTARRPTRSTSASRPTPRRSG